jgi:hypothetical protein
MDNIDWIYIILIFVVFIFIIWLFFGGNKHDYLGVDPIVPSHVIKNESYSRSIPAYSVCSSSKFEQLMSHRQLSELQRINMERDEMLQADSKKLLEICKNKPKKISDGEHFAKITIEKIYGVPFKKIRPDWLKNPETGRNLELDLYSDNVIIDGVKYCIAVEYSGLQHYQFPNKFWKSEKEFKNQIRRDIYKREMCDLNDVFLITVPYYISVNEMEKYIVSMIPESMLPRRYRGRVEN